LRRLRLADGLGSLGLRFFGFFFNATRLFGQTGRRTIRAGLFGSLATSRAGENEAQFFRHIFVNRTRVSLLFCNAQLGELVQQFVGLHFQLSGQKVNANLVHK
jgi:hypothetical protein